MLAIPAPKSLDRNGPGNRVERRVREENLARRRTAFGAGISLFLLAVAVAVLALWSFFRDHLTASAWLKLQGCRVDWSISRQNWKEGGTTTVSLSNMAANDIFGRKIGDHDVAVFRKLRGLDSLMAYEVDTFSDKGVASLAGLDRLRVLEIPRLNHYRMGRDSPRQQLLTDACIDSLRQLPRLEELSLAGNRITDRGMPGIARMSRLIRLDLSATEVTDAGLVHLAGLKGLREVLLGGTRVTPQGAKWLQAQLPDAEISLDIDAQSAEQIARDREGSKP